MSCIELVESVAVAELPERWKTLVSTGRFPRLDQWNVAQDGPIIGTNFGVRTRDEGNGLMRAVVMLWADPDDTGRRLIEVDVSPVWWLFNRPDWSFGSLIIIDDAALAMVPVEGEDFFEQHQLVKPCAVRTNLHGALRRVVEDSSRSNTDKANGSRNAQRKLDVHDAECAECQYAEVLVWGEL